MYRVIALAAVSFIGVVAVVRLLQESSFSHGAQYFDLSPTEADVEPWPLARSLRLSSEEGDGRTGGPASSKKQLRAALSSSPPTWVAKAVPSASTTKSPAGGHTTASRYLSLPWRMVPNGFLVDSKRCFTSPYWKGGSSLEERAAATQGMVDAVRYPDGPLRAERTAQCRAVKGLKVVQHVDDCPSGAVCAPRTTHVMKLYEHTQQSRSLTSTLEIAYDLLAMQPYAHMLSLNGKNLSGTTSVPSSAAFYFFSPQHCENVKAGRAFQPLNDDFESPWPHSTAHYTISNALVTRDTFRLISDRWRLPPFYGHYCGSGLFRWASKPHVVIFNKRPMKEWGAEPVNVISNSQLLQLYDLLSPRYVVVYLRPPSGLVTEDQDVRSVRDDLEALRQHAAGKHGPSAGEHLVIFNDFLDDLIESAAQLGDSGSGGASGGFAAVNPHEVMMSMMSEADGFIATQGGPAYLSLVWGQGKKAVLLEAKGMEANLGAMKWYADITGSPQGSVTSVRNAHQLGDAARQMFLS